MKNENDALEAVINKYSDTLYKICFVILKDEQDVRDVLQETFLTYYLKRPQFKSAGTQNEVNISQTGTVIINES